MSRRREKTVGGVRGGMIGGEAPKRQKAMAADALGEIIRELGLYLSEKEMAEARANIENLTAPETSWVRALIANFHKIDPSLFVVRSFAAPLEMAIAYALQDVESLLTGEQPELITDRVLKLRELTYADGSYLFPDPFAPDLPGSDSNRLQLTARLGELSSRPFDEFLADFRQGTSMQDYVWRNPRALEAEVAAERAKFLQSGRVAVEDAKGPACPRCGSKRTIVMTIQMRANDEAATNQFVCQNCFYSEAR